MTLLDENIRAQLREVFTELKHPVKIVFFGDETANCEYCEDTRQLLSEVADLAPEKIIVETYDLNANSELAQKHRVDKAPGFVILGVRGGEILDYGIRYAGIPAGHEFTSLINDILNVSRQDSGLKPETRQALKNLRYPVSMQVFVTPSCPYCPRAVILAHQMAMESDLIEAEMVEALEFPQLADQYGVSGVPHTIIKVQKSNNQSGFEEVVGAVPEKNLLEAILQAAQPA
ncbi:thioredoxin family protein [Thermanaerothrix sp. 4228-RoL]|jgi:glutaredoxin-like protein|uniref:Thioredoxin family protein n=1 Tax=Thermanaerothrix solaris TaxID=3058434 RepID=A0ABU3NRC0_9CHLR|nr:thioredoxin family protein [Thermanaerothrix sp. 4228-RoL]MDT8899377.1 thioredoxin family protein [Thermanaerothrix sp. 4228-RoL]